MNKTTSVAAIGGLAVALTGCAGTVSVRGINKTDFKIAKTSVASYKATTSVGSLGKVEVVQSPAPLNNAEVGRNMLDARDYSTLQRINDANGYIVGLQNGALDHLVAKYVKQIVPGLEVPGYQESAASMAESHLTNVRVGLNNGHSVAANLTKLEDSLSTLPEGAERAEMQTIAQTFRTNSSALQERLHYVIKVAREMDFYDDALLSEYGALHRTNTGFDPFELGKQVLESQNLKLPDLEGIAKDGSPYKVRDATTQLREKLTRLAEAGKITAEERNAGHDYITWQESLAAKVIPASNRSFLDYVPLLGMGRTIGRIEGGYSGISSDPDDIKAAQELVELGYLGLRDPINLRANETRTDALVGGATTVAPLISGLLFGGGSGGGSGGAGGAALYGGRGGRVGGPGFR